MQASFHLALFLTMAVSFASSVAQAQSRSHQFELSPTSLEATAVGNDKKAARRMVVFDLMARELPWSSKSLCEAALVFQHTNTEHEPDDGEQYRSQEMHLLAVALYKEAHRLGGGKPNTSFLGSHRYIVAMGLPRELSITNIEDPKTKELELEPDRIGDQARMRRGFPFALYAYLQTENLDPIPHELRNSRRDEEVSKLCTADQQTRALFRKDEMIFNRYIERVGDAQRRARLYEMMAEDVLWDVETMLNAAKVLNDTQSMIKERRKTRYLLQENHLFAYFLARQAFLKGEKSAAPLIVASLNTYLKVSKMPEQFGLQMTEGASPKICQKDAHVSVEQWGKYEFPFHLGRSVKALCNAALSASP